MKTHKKIRFFTFFLVITLSSQAHTRPRWLRLSWTGPTDTSITVSWTDDGGAGTAELRSSGDPPITETATTVITGESDLDTSFHVTFSDLDPDTTYEYRVCSGGHCSAWQEFRTAPEQGSCDPVRLVFSGDGRGEDILLGYMPSNQWPGVRDSIISEDPVAVMHTGDYVHDGDESSQWRNEMGRLNRLSSIIPFFLSLGNHDDGPGEGDDAYYNMIFDYPNDGPDGVEDYYSLLIGNVQVVCLSTHSFDMDTQITWLESVLATHVDDVDWRFVFFHVPVWSSGSHGSNEDDKTRASSLLPVLESYGVDVVFNGHDHNYERFHPSIGGHGTPRTSTPLSEDGGRRGEAEGVIYMVTGGAGALLNPLFGTHEDGSASGSNHLNYVVVDVSGDEAVLTIRDLGGCLGGLCGRPTVEGNLEVITLEKSETLCSSIPVDGDADVDTDVDADIDTDADVDADADLDADSDSDANADGDPDIEGDVATDSSVDANEDADVDTSDSDTSSSTSGSDVSSGSSAGCACRASSSGWSGLGTVAFQILDVF